jgi:cell wall-associated NlpC family hydrolase
MDVKCMARMRISTVYFTTIMLALLFLGTNPADAQSKKKRKKINKAVSVARSYLGTPYVYGGNGRGGIDCSGLIKNSYSAIGIDLPRTAKAQSKIGNKKGEGRVRPGDIVYFKFKEKRSKWWHSGMITYADDDVIKFIHASSSRGVVEDRMNDYYEKNVKFYRRVIK